MNNEIELSVRIELRQPQTGGPGISLQEEARLKVKDFMEAAKVLGLFHDLVEKLRVPSK